MANPSTTTYSRLPGSSSHRAADVASVVAAMASDCEADLRACQELAAAASEAAASQSAAGDRSAQVRELLDIVHKLGRLPRAGSARAGGERGHGRRQR